MVLTDLGKLAEKLWLAIPEHFPHVELDEYVVMPNHIHGILVLVDTPAQHAQAERAFGDVPRGSVPAIVRAYKAAVTREINKHEPMEGPLWQRNYYEHVIRSEKSLNTIREYIIENPMKWEIDELNVMR